MKAHRPQCDLAKPCEPDIPEHGLCGHSMRFCMHCMAWCYCEQLEDAEQRALAAAVQRVEATVGEWGISSDAPALVRIIAAIKGDQP